MEESDQREGYRELVQRQKQKSIRPIEQRDLFICDRDEDGGKQPRVVLLLGVPGIGKTFICFKLLEDILDNEIRFTDGNTIPYLITCREVNLIKDEISFKEFIFDFLGPSLDQEHQGAVWKYLQENEEHIVFLIDGYDECDGLGRNKNKDFCINFSSVDKAAPPQRLLYNLIAGRIMPKCKVFLTSRPYCSVYLNSLVDRTVQLDGLDKEKIREMVREILGPKNTNLCKSFNQYLDDNQHIAGLLYVPRHAQCLIDSVSAAYKGKEDAEINLADMPETMAGLFAMITLHMLKESVRHTESADYPIVKEILQRNKELLLKLSELAHWGIFEGTAAQQLFTKEDIQKVGLTVEELEAGIMSGYEIHKNTLLSRNTPVYVHSFPHLTIQEFLAAIWLVLKVGFTFHHYYYFIVFIKTPKYLGK